ncbi:MAG: hypothetical protein KDK09_07055, partial [Rhodobacteraceae bacterium]|nr:hypothetical protein [Paracoccaceae bacterium]
MPEQDPSRNRDRAHDRMLARWLWSGHIRAQIPWLLIAFVFMAFDGSMVGALSALLKPMFDQVLVEGQSARVLWIALAFAGTFVIRATTAFLYKTILAYTAERTTTGLQAQMTEHLVRLDQAFHHEHPPGH